MMRAFLVCAVFLLNACASSFTGLPGAKDQLSCKAPEGVACRSVSGTYENTIKRNLPAQRKSNDDKGNAKSSKVELKSYADEAHDLKKMKVLSSGDPLHIEPLIYRVWIAPWEDSDGALHDQSYIYMVVNNGRWAIENNKESIKSEFRPVYPLAKKHEKNPDEIKPKDSEESILENASSVKETALETKSENK